MRNCRTPNPDKNMKNNNTSKNNPHKAYLNQNKGNMKKKKKIVRGWVRGWVTVWLSGGLRV